MPGWASSKTRQCSGATPRRSAAIRNGSASRPNTASSSKTPNPASKAQNQPEWAGSKSPCPGSADTPPKTTIVILSEGSCSPIARAAVEGPRCSRSRHRSAKVFTRAPRPRLQPIQHRLQQPYEDVYVRHSALTAASAHCSAPKPPTHALTISSGDILQVFRRPAQLDSCSIVRVASKPMQCAPA